MLSFVGPLSNGSVIDAELFALWRGILDLAKLGVSESIVEGDSKVVVGWATGSQSPWRYLDKIEQIRHHTTKQEFQIMWTNRTSNTVADELARQGVFLSSELVN